MQDIDLFQLALGLTARTPRVNCPDCGVKQAAVPRARKNAGFTLLFEAMIMTLAKSMPVKRIVEMVVETDVRVWRILQPLCG